MIKDDLTIKQRLEALGYKVERVCRANGNFRGIRIIGPDGRPAHKTPLADVELGIEIIEELENTEDQIDMFAG